MPFAFLTIDPENNQAIVRFRDRSINADEARRLAIELFYVADELEGNEPFFGYEEEDSLHLAEIRKAIEECFDWETEEDRLEGDYVARVHQVAALLKKRNFQVVK